MDGGKGLLHYLRMRLKKSIQNGYKMVPTLMLHIVAHWLSSFFNFFTRDSLEWRMLVVNYIVDNNQVHLKVGTGQ